MQSKPDLVPGNPEIKACTLYIELGGSNDVIDRLCTISDWSLLKRVVVRIHRLAQGATTDQPLTVQEVDDSGKRVLRLIQHDSSSL